MFDTIFWTLSAITGAGVLIFVVAVIFDGLFDFFDFPIIHAIGVFLAGTGASTMIIRGMNITSLLIAVIAGAVLGFLMVILLVRLIVAAKRSEHVGRIIDFGPLIGSTAAIIWWDGTKGDVLVDLSGQRIKIPAESVKKIPSNSIIEVVDFERREDALVKVTVEVKKKENA